MSLLSSMLPIYLAPNHSLIEGASIFPGSFCYNNGLSKHAHETIIYPTISKCLIWVYICTCSFPDTDIHGAYNCGCTHQIHCLMRSLIALIVIVVLLIGFEYFNSNNLHVGTWIMESSNAFIDKYYRTKNMTLDRTLFSQKNSTWEVRAHLLPLEVRHNHMAL